MPGTLGRLPVPNRRKVGMTSSHHAPYVQGCKHATMLGTKGCDPARGSESQKAGLSSDRGLQPDPVKLESLVTAATPCSGNYVPGDCNHPPSPTKTGNPPSPAAYPCGRSRSRGGSAMG